jgi:small subunit ribosomal protein S1
MEDWDYQRPKRGEVRDGVILAIHEQEIIVDVGAKRDGVVPFADMQRLGDEAIAELSVGDELPVYILRPEDKDGNLLVSLFMARQEKAWNQAQQLAEKGEFVENDVVGYNKGGLVLPVGDIQGFIPASQIPGFPHGLSHDERLKRLSDMVGEKLLVKIIEINRRKRRLILSATAAQRQWRKRQRERLLEELREGEVRQGVVSSLCSFGAFVDLGGADGLIHLSELSWRRVRHPREVVSVGDEVEVYVLRLDEDRKRIGLSLKRLQPEPWALIEDKYELGQLVEGVVTNVVDFGAFAELEEGVEGLIHVSELTDASISHPREVVKKGDLLLLRIIRIDIRRKRLGLSLKRVLESEWAEWAARLAVAEPERVVESRKAEEEEQPSAEVGEAGEEAQEPIAAAVEEGEQEEEPLAAALEEDLDLAETGAVSAEEELEAEEPVEALAEVGYEAEETVALVSEESPEAEELPVVAAEEDLEAEETVEALAEADDEAEEAVALVSEESPEAEELPAVAAEEDLEAEEAVEALAEADDEAEEAVALAAEEGPAAEEGLGAEEAAEALAEEDDTVEEAVASVSEEGPEAEEVLEAEEPVVALAEEDDEDEEAVASVSEELAGVESSPEVSEASPEETTETEPLAGDDTQPTSFEG